jgi:hypothetical protein
MKNLQGVYAIGIRETQMVLLSLTASVLLQRWIKLRPLNTSWRYPVKQQSRSSLRCKVMGTGTSFVPHSGAHLLKMQCPELYYFPNRGQELEVVVLKKALLSHSIACDRS